MTQAKVATENTPVWVDLATSDAPAARAFYAKLFGWSIDPNPDPQFGGYAVAMSGDTAVAGISPKQTPDAPTAWSLYIGTADSAALVSRVTAAGGTVVAPPFEVGDQGTMSVFQDPSGAFICSWESNAMTGFGGGGANTFVWAELNARGVDKALPFYQQVFGWTTQTHDMGGMTYHEFKIGEQSVGGAQEMMTAVPAEVPSNWLVYFGVDDVDASFRIALDGGGTELVAPMDFPGGRFAVVGDPQGAAFGLLKAAPPE
jgi:uncharacterized protein